MCGIVGIWDSRAQRPIDRAALVRMNESQHHRGPDESGMHIVDGLGFGHKRLSIIDLATGQQPLFNEDHSVVVTYNGEIYNYVELIAELTALGHVFRTRSDTEVIVHAWEAWGQDCVSRFRGMFAFAIWDNNRQTLFLARDRLGVKPLFYGDLPDGTWVFASELKAVLAYGAVPRQIDPRSVEDFFTLGYVPEPRTIYRSVHKLAPGHTLLLERGRPAAAPRRYWDVRFHEGPALELAEAQAELISRLEECVRLRMVAEVPLGAFLSGGVDSSAVVAMMARRSTEPVNTCSISFDDPRFDETRFAAQVAQRYQTRHFVDQVKTDDFDLIDTLAVLYDEPYADSSAIPTYRVCQLARRHVTVALSGDGGDESFGGYRRYLLHLAEERFRSALPLGLRQPVFGALGRWYPKADWAPRFVRAKSTFQSLARDSVAAYLHSVSIFRDDMRPRLYSAGFKRELGGYQTVDLFREHAARAQTDDPLSLIQYIDMQTYLVGDINTKVDRASMAHALEVREPLMDHELVQWVAGLPSRLKVNGSEGKWLLKKTLEPHLPHDIMYRPKMGFAVPLIRWFRGPLRERMQEAVLGERLRSTGMFDPTYLTHLVEAHASGRRDYSGPLWSLLMFDAFLRQSEPDQPSRPVHEATAVAA